MLCIPGNGCTSSNGGKDLIKTVAIDTWQTFLAQQDTRNPTE